MDTYEALMDLLPFLPPHVARNLVMATYNKLESADDDKFFAHLDLLGHTSYLIGEHIRPEEIANLIAFIKNDLSMEIRDDDCKLNSYDELIMVIRILKAIGAHDELEKARLRAGVIGGSDLNSHFWEAEVLAEISGSLESEYRDACYRLLRNGEYPEDLNEFDLLINEMNKFPSLIDLRNEYLEECVAFYSDANDLCLTAHAQHYLGKKEEAESNFRLLLTECLDELNFLGASTCADMLGETEFAKKLKEIYEFYAKMKMINSNGVVCF